MHHQEKRQLGLVAAITVALVGGGLLFATGDGNDSVTAANAPVEVAAAPAVASGANAAAQANVASNAAAASESGTATDGTTVASGTGEAASTGTDPAAASAGDETGCVITERSLGSNSKGSSVECLQKALATAGYYSGAIDGEYSGAVASAVRKLQEAKKLYVDGITGRETGLVLGIWPNEQSLVIRTPKPAPGSKDLAGFPLSNVASAGDKAPKLPENSGSGRRLVYSRAAQRVWAVDAKGRIVRSWLVSGSKYNNELPGRHKVYSRSIVTTAWNGAATLPKMVRWLDTERGAIGFHQIPVHRSDGTKYQTEAELGTRLSGGCQRQTKLDADFTWAWATIGTPVIVV